MQLSMTRTALGLGLLLANIGLLFSQTNLRPGDWRAYLHHGRAIESIYHRGWVFSITSGGMFSYDPATQEIQTYSTIDGLSDINPTAIHEDPINEVAYIGYQDGTINFFEDPRDIRVITDIARNNFFVAKAINDFDSDEGFLYTATDFGIVIFRLDNQLPAFTVRQFSNESSRIPVVSVTLFEGRIWATLEGGELYSAPIGFPNLSDPNIWELENGVDGLPLSTVVLEAKGNQSALFARTENIIYERRNGSWQRSSRFTNSEGYNHLFVQEDMVGVSRLSAEVLVNDTELLGIFTAGAIVDVLRTPEGEYFIAKQFRGVDRRLTNGEIINITPSGPASNIATDIAAYQGEVYVAPRGISGDFSPARDLSGVYYFQPEVGWTILDRESGLDPERVNNNFARAFIDPNTQTAYIGSYARGIVVLQNGTLQTLYDCDNSGLSTIFGVCLAEDLNFQDTRVSGISVDDNGYLWATLNLAQEPLVVKTPDDQWLQVPDNRFGVPTEFIGMISDELGSKWIINRRKGLVVYNDNRTPEDLQDDRVVNLNPIRTNQDENCDPTSEALSLAMDLDGAIWVGTSRGVVVYYDPFSIAAGEPVLGTRPVFNGRCLLENERVLSIAVDGANRKWFATANGVFVTNEDGTDQVQRFTTQNSPLLSNRVEDIAIDQATGEVFFATDRGVISYASDATESVTGCDEVFVYPNPVFSDYDGDVVIKGSGRGVTVRITTVSGRLVRELTANGGTTTWDGRDISGEKVHSGIYLAMMSDDDGENACIGKFAVIRR